MPDPTLYLTSDVELKSVADAIRAKGNTSAQLTYPSGFNTAIGNLPVGTDCNATASDIVSGKTAIVNRTKITGNVPVKSASDVTITDSNTVNVPAGKYSSAVSKTVGTKKAAETFDVSGSNRSIAAGQYLTGAQTIRAVTTSNIDPGNIRGGVTVKVGDSGDAGRIKNVTGTYTGYDFGLQEFVFSKSDPSYIGTITVNKVISIDSAYYNLPDLASRTKLVVRGIGCNGSWGEFSSSVTKGSTNTILVSISMRCTSSTGSFTLQVRPTYC